MAVTTSVIDNELVVLGKHRHLGVPHVNSAREAVQKNYGVALLVTLGVQLDVFNLDLRVARVVLFYY